MSLHLPICHVCNTTVSRKQRTNITENVTNPPFLDAQLTHQNSSKISMDRLIHVKVDKKKKNVGESTGSP